jgi:anaerobic selenocysteine-containing dehydrogenase
VTQSFSGIGDDAQGFVRYRTGDISPWNELLDRGVWVGQAYEYRKYNSIFKTPSNKFEFNSGNLADALKISGFASDNGLTSLPHYERSSFLGEELGYPLVLLTYHPLLVIENGSQNYPWAQQMFLVKHGIGWTNVVEINAATARELGVKDKDMVWVESPFNRIKARARVIEGIHPQVIAIARGQGHYAYGQWSSGIGVNPNEIVGVDYDRLSGQSAFYNTRVRVLLDVRL